MSRNDRTPALFALQLASLRRFVLALALFAALPFEAKALAADLVAGPGRVDIAPLPPVAAEPGIADPAIIGPAIVAGPAVVLDPLSDRCRTTPTGWYWYYGVSIDFLSGEIAEKGLRVIDVEVDNVSPFRVNAVLVRNSGAYRKTWWWYVGLTAAQVTERINAHGARIIDLNAYDAGGSTRFAVVMISNTGADRKSWWWYYGTLDYIGDRASANGARIVDLDRYTVGSTTRYSAVMIRNAGVDASGWWWYVGLTASQLSDRINQHRARSIDLETYPTSQGARFNVVLLPNTGADSIRWWWYYNVSAAQVSAFASQNGARVVDLESMPSAGGSRRFAVLLVNNSNAQTSRLAGLLNYGNDGATGALVKRVGGSVLASLQPDEVFEPASTIKALPHLFALTQIQNTRLTLDSLADYCATLEGSCPISPPCNGPDRRLEWLLQQMMWVSDNAATDAVVRRFGRNTLNAFAQSIGMDRTRLQHILGCGGPLPNELTLSDITRLYEVATDLLDEEHQDIMYRLMSGKGDTIDFTGAWGSLSAIIDQEGAAQGLSSAVRRAFKDGVRFANKAGNYTLWRNNRWEYFTSSAGWISLPTCSVNPQSRLDYVFGFFIDGATSQSSTSARFASLRGEILREQIRDALDRFSSSCTPAPQLVRFIRGDVDIDGRLSVSDGQFILNALFRGGDDPRCEDAADVNDSGRIDVADASALFGFLFLGTQPPAGGPPGVPQVDQTADALGCAQPTSRGGGL